MKRIFALLLAIMMIFSLVACVEEVESDNDGKTNTGDVASKSKNKITFTELVAVDNDECSIKITGIDPDDMWGYSLNVQLENKSADKKYMFSVESAYINGVGCDPFFASEVAAGKKAKEDISFSDKTFKENLGDYTDIELTFRVYDSDDWSADAVALETVHVYPYGKENAETFVRNAKKSDKVLVDNDKATVILLGFEDDEIWGYTANLFIVNKSDKYAMFTVEDVSVNGYMVDPLFASDIDSGKCAFDTMSWSDEDFEESGITEVEEIEFTLRAYDNENFLADDIVNEKITINP